MFAVANVISFTRLSYVLPANELFGPMQISLAKMISVSIVRHNNQQALTHNPDIQRLPFDTIEISVKRWSVITTPSHDILYVYRVYPLAFWS